MDKAKAIDPLTVAYFNYQTISLYLLTRYEEALDTLKEALQLYPTVLRLYDFMARVYVTIGRYEEAIEIIHTGFRTSKIRPPSMVAYLATAYVGIGETSKAKELQEELIKRSDSHEKGVNIYLVHTFQAVGDIHSALQWLEKAKNTNDVDLIWWNVDPLLKTIREQSHTAMQSSRAPDFESAEKQIIKRLENEMPNLPYHNIGHVYDVLNASLVIAQEERLGEEEVKLLRVAALFHDAGFIYSPKQHEERGAAMVREALPAYGFNGEQIEAIGNMILATHIPQSPTTLLEKILCDADLDYLGRKDFYEIGDRLLEELTAQGVVETEREWNLVQKTFLESHRYHTEYSKRIRQNSKKERLAEIIAKLKPRS